MAILRRLLVLSIFMSAFGSGALAHAQCPQEPGSLYPVLLLNEKKPNAHPSLYPVHLGTEKKPNAHLALKVPVDWLQNHSKDLWKIVDLLFDENPRVIDVLKIETNEKPLTAQIDFLTRFIHSAISIKKERQSVGPNAVIGRRATKMESRHDGPRRTQLSSIVMHLRNPRPED